MPIKLMHFKSNLYNIRLYLISLLFFFVHQPVLANINKLYQKHCANCHSSNRLGGMGPALLPQNLNRLKKSHAEIVIKDGRAASQMPAFSSILSQQQIKQLTDYIYTPLTKTPIWDKKEINSTHKIFLNKKPDSAKPIFKADPQNLFIVVELGDHHATLLNGDTFSPIHRFSTHFAVHGGPKFSPDGRYVYFASRDGWISKYDIYNLRMVAEIRAGINTRNAAVSFDGRYVAVGNYLPHSLVILNATDLSLIEVIPVKNAKGDTSRVSAVYTAPPRNSFIFALKDLPEIWEIPYQPDSIQNFPISRIQLNDYLDDFFFDNTYQFIIGASRPTDKSSTKTASAQVIDLNKKKKIADINLPGMPHLGSGISWKKDNKTLLATPNLKTGDVAIIDMSNWKIVKNIKTLGPGFFMRSHENSTYAWVDVFFGPHKNKVHIINKQTLEIEKTIAPVENKTAAHIEFTKNGSHALLSIWDLDGAIIVYDAKTLKEVKRIPMKKPSGKYNVYNKTHYVSGTSH